jgi:hypothetical protein
MSAPFLPPLEDGFKPGRLWSLWDMFKFDALAFYRATTEIQHQLTWIENHKLTSIKNHADGSMTVFHIEDELVLNIMLERLNELRAQLAILGADMTVLTVDRLRTAIEVKMVTYDQLKSGYHEISNRLRDELLDTEVYALEPRERLYFSPREPLFGREFSTKFPTAGAFELDEAAKCLALGRPTASVFHLMRLMEVGIKAAAACLTIPPPTRGSDRNWGKVLEKIKDELDRRNGARPTGWSVPADKEFFAEIHASLDAVRVAWRNTTMHVENKYTDDEAEHIFVAVKGFMKKLASRMNEDGDPKA